LLLSHILPAKLQLFADISKKLHCFLTDGQFLPLLAENDGNYLLLVFESTGAVEVSADAIAHMHREAEPCFRHVITDELLHVF
jgi:hypothetical protein